MGFVTDDSRGRITQVSTSTAYVSTGSGSSDRTLLAYLPAKFSGIQHTD